MLPLGDVIPRLKMNRVKSLVFAIVFFCANETIVDKTTASNGDDADADAAYVTDEYDVYVLIDSMMLLITKRVIQFYHTKQTKTSITSVLYRHVYHYAIQQTFSAYVAAAAAVVVVVLAAADDDYNDEHVVVVIDDFENVRSNEIMEKHIASFCFRLDSV